MRAEGTKPERPRPITRHDNLYRLDYSQLNGTTNLDNSHADNGNIAAKSDAGNYAYNATQIHAVDSVTGGPLGSKYFSYNAAGNMDWSTDTGCVSYYANTQMKYVAKDANNTRHFQYAPDRGRWRHYYNRTT